MATKNACVAWQDAVAGPILAHEVIVGVSATPFRTLRRSAATVRRLVAGLRLSCMFHHEHISNTRANNTFTAPTPPGAYLPRGKPERAF